MMYDELLLDFTPVEEIARARGEHEALQAKLTALCSYLRPLVEACRPTRHAGLELNKIYVETERFSVRVGMQLRAVAGPGFGYLTDVLFVEALRRLGVRVENGTRAALNKGDWERALLRIDHPDMHAARAANEAGDIDVDAGLVNLVMGGARKC